ncbi:unnamed protein product [Bursaphelenchus okinawaensis]|uniref:Uncharacterized protein n=1 Tax=Bursaphelenchus okinawaensis TaxID=465554 RepID=A0A811JQK3_9BILA|nr:unnamed protein product [Bursaphelenchus okinawaensis]CAG9078601.1 unnamed protein product [Bursaphelenchus okinawaensis]
MWLGCLVLCFCLTWTSGAHIYDVDYNKDHLKFECKKQREDQKCVALEKDAFDDYFVEYTMQCERSMCDKYGKDILEKVHGFSRKGQVSHLYVTFGFFYNTKNDEDVSTLRFPIIGRGRPAFFSQDNQVLFTSEVADDGTITMVPSGMNTRKLWKEKERAFAYIDYVFYDKDRVVDLQKRIKKVYDEASFITDMNDIPGERVSSDLLKQIREKCFVSNEFCAIDTETNMVINTPYPSAGRLGKMTIELLHKPKLTETFPYYQFHHEDLPNHVFYFKDVSEWNFIDNQPNLHIDTTDLSRTKPYSFFANEKKGMLRSFTPWPKHTDKIFTIMKKIVEQERPTTTVATTTTTTKYVAPITRPKGSGDEQSHDDSDDGGHDEGQDDDSEHDEETQNDDITQNKDEDETSAGNCIHLIVALLIGSLVLLL